MAAGRVGTLLATCLAVAGDDDWVRHPHDTLFQLAFGDPEVARAELLAVVPDEVCAQLDFSRMRQVPSRTVSRRLKSQYTDVMYEVPLRGGGTVFLWFLLEHQSTSPPLMAFRFLRYEVHRWSVYLRSKAGRERGRLPMVVPVLLLHDPRGRRPPARLSDLYDAPLELVEALRPLLPDFTFLVDDLMARSEADLAQRSASAVYTLTLWLLRARGEVPEAREEAYRRLFERLAAEGQVEVGQAMMHYVLNTSRAADPVALRAAREASPGLTEAVMGIWQQRIQEGEAQGREAGREEGREAGREEGDLLGRTSMLLRLLEARFGPVSTEVEARVRDADSASLERWAVRVLTAQAIGEVFEDG